MFLFGFILGLLGGVALMAMIEPPEKWIDVEDDEDQP